MLTTTPIGQMLEPHVGLEPATFSMARRRATTAPMGQNLAEAEGLEPTSDG